jgi:curved DNA-binding protein CbpA
MRKPGPDHYRALGVPRDATVADIARAYRLQARAVHPDTAPAATGAAARFRAVAEACQVLSDPARRARYDQARSYQAAPEHGTAAPDRARPGSAAGMPLAWPRAAAGLGLAQMPVLWAGPVRVEPLPGAASGSGPGGASQAVPACRAGLVRWRPGERRGGLW